MKYYVKLAYYPPRYPASWIPTNKIHPNIFIYYYSPRDPKSYAFILRQSPTSLFSLYCSWTASCFLHILLILFLGTKLNHLTIFAVSGGFPIPTDVLHRIGPMTYLMTYHSLVSCGMCATSCYELQTMVLHTSFKTIKDNEGRW